MASAVWVIPDNNFLAAQFICTGDAGTITISEWIPAMFWMDFCFQWAFGSASLSCTVYEQGIKLLLIFKAGSFWHQLYFSWLLQTNKTFFKVLWRFGRSLTFLTVCSLKVANVLYFSYLNTNRIHLFWSWQELPTVDPMCGLPFKPFSLVIG